MEEGPGTGSGEVTVHVDKPAYDEMLSELDDLSKLYRILTP